MESVCQIVQTFFIFLCSFAFYKIKLRPLCFFADQLQGVSISYTHVTPICVEKSVFRIKFHVLDNFLNLHGTCADCPNVQLCNLSNHYQTPLLNYGSRQESKFLLDSLRAILVWLQMVVLSPQQTLLVSTKVFE